MNNLQPGTRGSDVDDAIEDAPEQRPCPMCGHDAGECTCLMEEVLRVNAAHLREAGFGAQAAAELTRQLGDSLRGKR